MSTPQQQHLTINAGRKLIALLLMVLLTNPAAALNCAMPAGSDGAVVEEELSLNQAENQVATQAELPPCHRPEDEQNKSKGSDKFSVMIDLTMDCCDEAQCQCVTACQSMDADCTVLFSALDTVSERLGFAETVILISSQSNPFRPPIA